MDKKQRTGTQCIERAFSLLRELATHGKFGWSLGELADRCGLDHGTTHRVLSCLVRERLAHQRTSNRQYVLGPLIFELGLAIPSYLEFQAACQRPVKRVAADLGGTSMLNLRSGSDLVCAARAGPAVYGGTIVDVGTRRPLLSSVGGAAILITLPGSETRNIVEQNKRQLYRKDRESIRLLERMLKRSRSLGYAFNKCEVSNDVHSFGVPIKIPKGPVFASLTVGGSAAEFCASRAEEFVKRLRREATSIERKAEKILAM